MKAKNLALMLVFMAPSVGFAAPITVTVNSITGTWENVDPASVSGAGTSAITWGDPATASGPSGYTFAGVTVPAGPFNAGDDFTLGTFTHNNFPVFPPSLASADLSVDIEGFFSDGTSDTNFSLTSVFSFDHFETTNNASPCAAGGAQPCPDLVTPTLNSGATTTVDINGESFGFNLSGFQVDGTDFTSFLTLEEQANSADLRASFGVLPTNGVPVPSTLGLIGLCLLGLARRAARSLPRATEVRGRAARVEAVVPASA